MRESRLPTLNALRAFEVAARHMSFKNAADELCITPTAISHRIRSLEDWLGVKLFNRLTRSLELTKEGAAYAKLVHEGFEILARASDELRKSSEGGDLVVSTTMSFASNWLTPRLASFYEEDEELSVRIEGSDLVVDLNRSNVDIAIRMGEGDYEGLHSEMLFPDLVTPVCTPELAAGMSTPNDLLDIPRIEYRWPGFSETDPSWEKWFRVAGVSTGQLDPVPSFSEEHMVLNQALAGRGVALVGMVAAADSILAGKLVRPFQVGLEDRAYYFVCLPNELGRRKIRSFYDWIKDEAMCFDALVQNDPRLSCAKTVRSEEV